MSKLVRTLMLGAMLAAMNLAAATAIAQEQTTTDDAVELFRAGERASQKQITGDAAPAPAEATEPARPAEAGGGPGLLVIVMLAALAAALAAMAATRATRRVRARQAV